MSRTKTVESKIEISEKTAVGASSWFQDELLTFFKAGVSHVFLVHGNINGLVANPDAGNKNEEPYISLKKFWEKTFDTANMAMFYNIASGIRFLNKDTEREFKQINGLDSDGSSGDPIAAAKAGLAAKRGIPREPELALPLIERVLYKSKNCALVVNSAHFIAPTGFGGSALLPPERANVERLKNWIQSETIKTNRNIILFITDYASKVSMELKQSGSGISQILIPKPSKDARREFIRFLSNRYKDNLAKNFDVEVFTHATQGMNLQQILDIFLYASQSGEPIDIDYVRLKKKEILNSEFGDVMEIVEPTIDLDGIGGLEYLKSFFKEVLNAIKQGENRLVPMGITLMGPPGTGKTAIVEALAKEAGFNFVKIKNVRSMWLGESESRQEKVIYGLRSLAPVVVMNDEADLNDADRNAPRGDSGVGERLQKMWMEFLSDPKIRGQVVVINCTNRPDRIDPALKRSGRSDERFLVPMPSEKEMKDIFKVAFKRHKISTTIKDFSDFARLTNGFSGADVVEKIVPTAYRFAFQKNKKTVDEESLRLAIEDFIPSASQGEIDRMTILSILECSSRRLLPPNIKEIVQQIKKRNLVLNIQELITQIEERHIVKLDDEPTISLPISVSPELRKKMN